MDAGKEAVDWLYHEHLGVDDDWAVDAEGGFTWWPDQHAQTVSVLSDYEGPDGGRGYVVSVRTEVAHGVRPAPQTLLALSGVFPLSSMAGLVLDADEGTLALHTVALVHSGNSWVRPLIGLAAALQIGEAPRVGRVAEAVAWRPSTGGHPTRGPRPEPDPLASATEQFVLPFGAAEPRWAGDELAGLPDGLAARPPCLLATGSEAGLAAEFPYGPSGSSLCRLETGVPHPHYGNGLSTLQSFPVDATDVEGARVALALNALELASGTSDVPFGFGGYHYDGGAIHHTGFIPNVAYRPGILTNVYLGCAARARAVDAWMTGSKWGPESFDFARTSIARLERNSGP